MQGALGGLGGFAIEAALQLVQLRGRQNAVRNQTRAHSGDGIAKGVGLALGSGAIVLVIVGQGMRVEPHTMAVYQRRAAAGAAVRRRLLKCTQAGHGIVAVDFREIKVGEIGHQTGDVSARRVHLNGNADGVAVVFDHKDTGSF